MSRPVLLFTLTFCLLVGGLYLGSGLNTPVAAEPLTPTDILWPPSSLSPGAVILVSTKKVDVLAHGIAYDPARNRIYATVGETGLPRDNAVVPVTPGGTVENKIPVDGIPQLVVSSGDGQFLYVSLWHPGDDRPYMQRVNLADGTTEPKWELVPGDSDVCGYTRAGDMFTLPGDPHALVVARLNTGCSPSQEGVAVYDDGVMRPRAEGEHSGPTNIEPSESPDVIYGTTPYSWPGGVVFMTVDAEGVTITGSVTAGQVPGSDFTIVDGLLYFDNGLVFDPVAAKTVGRFDLGEATSPAAAIDPQERRAYFIVYGTMPQADPVLMMFDQDSRRFLASAAIPGLTGSVDEFVSIAPGRLAVRTTDQELILIDVKSLEHALFTPLLADDYCAPFFDTFNDPLSGWPAGANVLGGSGYVNGEYRIFSQEDGYVFLRRAPACDRENYEVETTARWEGPTGALYGITFGVRGDFDWFYWFAINSDSQRFVLYRFEPNRIVTLAGPDARHFITQGNGVNRMRVLRQGSLIRLFVNGQEIGQVTDTTIHGKTAVGLAMAPYDGEPNADARFDNFRYEWRPPENVPGAGANENDTAAPGHGVKTEVIAPTWERQVSADLHFADAELDVNIGLVGGRVIVGGLPD